MKNINIFFKIMITLALVGLSVKGEGQTTYEVPTDYTTIQEAINVAVDGDTVLVLEGTYVENINFNGKNIIVGSEFIIDNDTSHISQTVIDGNQSGSVVTFKNGETSNTELNGFTITNGNGSNNSGQGGGIFIKGLVLINGTYKPTNPTLKNLVITGNSATSGGGIHLTSNTNVGMGSYNTSLENVDIKNNTATSGGGFYSYLSAFVYNDGMISGNTATNGGGIWVYYGNAYYGGCRILANLKIHDNTATNDGGGIWIDNAWHPDYLNFWLYNFSIYNNHAGNNGGGIALPGLEQKSWTARLRMRGGILVDNSADNFGGALYCKSSCIDYVMNITVSGNTAGTDNGNGFYVDNSAWFGTINNSIFWSNSTNTTLQDIYIVNGLSFNGNSYSLNVEYSNIENGQAGIIANPVINVTWDNNIDTDPLFIGNGDHPFALQQGSPSINTGNPITSLINDAQMGTVSSSSIAVLNTDLAGEERIIEDIINMGAYEKSDNITHPTPVITCSQASHSDSTSLVSLNFSVSFDEDVTNFTIDKVLTENSTVTDFSGSGSLFTFTVTADTTLSDTFPVEVRVPVCAARSLATDGCCWSAVPYVFEYATGSNIKSVILTFEASEGYPGDTNVSVPVLLDNLTDLTTPIAGLQFNINYDATKGIHANGNSNLTNRTTDFTSSITVHDNGANSYLHVLLFNTSNNEIINSGTGSIVDILFDVNDTASVGNFSDLIFSDVMLSDSLAQSVPVIFSENGIFTINEPFELGDINEDGDINILDIVMLINIINTNTYIVNADLNNDTYVNILDLIILVNIINENSKGEIYDIKGGNIITLPELSLNSGASGSFNIQTNNPDIISAAEFSFGYNSLIGFDIISLELPENMNNDFELSYIINSEDPANVNINVIVYSLTNKEIAVGVSDIVKVNYTTSETANGFSDLSFTSAILCNSNATALETETVSGMLTIGDANSVEELQIHNFNVFPNPFSETAKIEFILKRASNVSFTVYNLMGELVYESSKTAFEKGKNNYEINLNGQPGGTYFISINIDNKRYYHKLIKQ